MDAGMIPTYLPTIELIASSLAHAHGYKRRADMPGLRGTNTPRQGPAGPKTPLLLGRKTHRPGTQHTKMARGEAKNGLQSFQTHLGSGKRQGMASPSAAG